jgi:hypothetical protein
MASRKISKLICLGACTALAAASMPSIAQAQRGAGARSAAAARPAGGSQARQVRSQASTSVDRNQNVNQNINRNTNNVGNNVNTGNRNNINTGNINTGDVNIDRDVNIDVDNGYGWDNDWDGDHYHPIAGAAVVTAAVATTAWVVGSYYRSLPPNCATIYRGTVIYYQCGTYWYQPIYSGSSVQYVAVVAP